MAVHAYDLVHECKVSKKIFSCFLLNLQFWVLMFWDKYGGST